MPIKMIVMVKRKAGLTPEQFRDGYENSHARIATDLFGHLWLAYRRNYLISGRKFSDDRDMTRRRDADEIGFDAISEFILRDEAALEEMGRIAAENYDMIKADEALWFDQAHCWNVSCDTVEADLSSSTGE